MCSSDSPPSSSLMMKSLSLSSRGSTGKLLRKMSRRAKDFQNEFSPKALKLPASLHQLPIKILDLSLHLRNYFIFHKHPRGTQTSAPHKVQLKGFCCNIDGRFKHSYQSATFPNVRGFSVLSRTTLGVRHRKGSSDSHTRV